MWYKLAHKQDFLSNLESLTSEFVEAAQKIYDGWDEDPDVYFGGGICHLIADAFVEIVYKHYPHYTASTFTRDDIQHVETIVYNIDSDSLNDDDVDEPIDRLKLLSYCTTFVKLACFLFFAIYCFL